MRNTCSTRNKPGASVCNMTARHRHSKTDTLWTIVIAFILTQLIILCGHTPISLSATRTTTTTTSNDPRISSQIMAVVLADSPPSINRKHSHLTHQSLNSNNNRVSLVSSPNPAPDQTKFLNNQYVNPQHKLFNSQQQHQYQFAHNHYSPVNVQSTFHSSHSLISDSNNGNSDELNSSERQENAQSRPLVSNSGSTSFDDSLDPPTGRHTISNNNRINQASNNNEEQLIGSGTNQQGHQARSDALNSNQVNPTEQPVSSARERCRELISLTLLSFKDLSPDERASEELDCARLREQIAAATGRGTSANSRRNIVKSQSPSRSRQIQPLSDQSDPPTPVEVYTTGEPQAEEEGKQGSAAAAIETPTPNQQPTDEYPLNQFRPSSPYQQQSTSQQQLLYDSPQSIAGQLSANPLINDNKFNNVKPNSRDLQVNSRPLISSNPSNKFNPSSFPLTHQNTNDNSGLGVTDQAVTNNNRWEPRNSYLNQVQQLLIQQQQQQDRQRQQDHQSMMQLYHQLTSASRAQASASREATTTTTTTLQPTTEATTFESLLETTTMPPTTTSTTTTTTTTTPRPNTPKIRVGAPPGNGGRRRGGGRAMRTSTTTTTTTTTTPKPSTLADYSDGSDASTDYYDEYDDQQNPTTTTTTTTIRPHRHRDRKQKRRFRTSSTTPRPTTSSTTLSPGYQPRPDGRIIDYMADPNFPRELKGADLTNYPFYVSVPDKIDFDCKGRHDGYYTNINLHCQIYHHCAIGNRYDFLCPNYTLFDQTTFTCRFINTVDCDGSAKHFDRNNALYVEKDDYKSGEQHTGSSSTTTSTTSSTTSTTSTSPTPRLNIQLSHRSGHGVGGLSSGLHGNHNSKTVGLNLTNEQIR